MRVGGREFLTSGSVIGEGRIMLFSSVRFHFLWRHRKFLQRHVSFSAVDDSSDVV